MHRAHRTILGIGLLLAILIAPARASGQSQAALRVGLSDIAAPTATLRAPIASDSHDRWVKGAVIGGVVGLGLALLYHAVVDDSQHNGRRAVEFTIAGAVIGSLIAER